MHNNSFDSLTEVGGYFGLDLPTYGDPFPDTLKFQSARAALHAVLEFAGIKRVLLPGYICNNVVKSVLDSGAEVETYFLDDTLYPQDLPTAIPEESVVIYVNYFGLCQNNIDRLLQAVPPKQLIIDNSQALFAKPANVLATIYSLRKYIGVPDGGLLLTSLEIKMPENEDTGSLDRMRHLLLRMAYPARTGYSSFLESEKSLNDTKPLKMSRLTNRILSSINMNEVKQRRRENFFVLAAQLDKLNEYKWSIGSDSVPLCYPLIVDKSVDLLKQRLISKGIFIPTYWPEVISKTGNKTIEYRLLHCSLFIPCDQRYTTRQMNTLAGIITACLEA